MIITLYINKSNENALNKNLKKVGQIEGFPRKDFSILEPSINVTLNDCPSFNYCEIKSLHRFYFVKSLTGIVKNLYNLNLFVDVLQSYKYIIQNATVKIMESNKANNYLNNGYQTEEKLQCRKILFPIGFIPDGKTIMIV